MSSISAESFRQNMLKLDFQLPDRVQKGQRELLFRRNRLGHRPEMAICRSK